MKNVISFIETVGKLKELKRKGWQLRGIPDPESVADHSYIATVLAYSISEKLGLDADKCSKMTLFHDVPECLVGDITPHDGISKEKKYVLEKDAMKKLSYELGNSEPLELWLEYEKQESPEAKFVYEIDKLEMVFQALHYEKKHNRKLDEFWETARAEIKNPYLKTVYSQLLSQRKK